MTPRLAARFGEQYRRESKAEDDRAALRLGVFSALMKCRAQILHPDAITALNLIDVAFIDSRSVRDAWRHFLQAANVPDEQFNAVALVERYQGLIHSIARDLNLGDQISLSDVQLAYYPQALGRLDQAAMADAEEKIARRALATSPARAFGVDEAVSFATAEAPAVIAATCSRRRAAMRLAFSWFALL